MYHQMHKRMITNECVKILSYRKVEEKERKERGIIMLEVIMQNVFY